MVEFAGILATTSGGEGGGTRGVVAVSRGQVRGEFWLRRESVGEDPRELGSPWRRLGGRPAAGREGVDGVEHEAHLLREGGLHRKTASGIFGQLRGIFTCWS